MAQYLIRLSRAVNRQVTGNNVMLCATAHERGWTTFVKVFDFLFLWKHHKHCEVCYIYELRVSMRYHEFIQSELRKERQMRQGELFPPPVHCCYCGKLVPQPFFVVKHFGHMTSQLAYCNETCANEHYLEKVREGAEEKTQLVETERKPNPLCPCCTEYP